MKKCPLCSEEIIEEAIKCTFCGEVFVKAKSFDGRRFRVDLEKLFPSIYLTMLSMIQGVTFGFLMWNLYGFFGKFLDYGLQEQFSFLLLFIMSFFVLVLIWYDYLYNLLLIRPPNRRDAIFPFFFGITQVGMAQSLSLPIIWIVFAASTGIVAIFAYENTRNAYMKNIEEKRIKKEIKFDNVLKKRINLIQLKKIILVYVMIFPMILILTYYVINAIIYFINKEDKLCIRQYIEVTLKRTDIFLIIALFAPLIYFLSFSFYLSNQLFKYAGELRKDGCYTKTFEIFWRRDWLKLEKKFLIPRANKLYYKILKKQREERKKQRRIVCPVD